VITPFLVRLTQTCIQQTFRLVSILNISLFITGTANADPIKNLFSARNAQPTWQPQPTFIFFIQGAADHFVPKSTTQVSQLTQVDQVDSKIIRQLAKQCQRCNVVILHVQQGQSKWYHRAHPHATYLRIYNRGKKLLSRHVPNLNSADPALVTSLLKLTQNWFPASPLHLIYRGHSIYPSYSPSVTEDRSSEFQLRPFDVNHPESPYGIEIFASAIREAHLNRKLSTLTFASCSMAYLDVAAAMSPFAELMIASQTDVLEVLSVGFDYHFLTRIETEDSTRLSAKKIARSLLRKFRTTPSLIDAMMEHSISVIDLSDFSELKDQFNSLLSRITSIEMTQTIAPVEKFLSDRYIQYQRQQGLSQKEVGKLLEATRITSTHIDQQDLIRFLEFLSSQLDSHSELSQETLDLIDRFQSRLAVHYPSRCSKNSGLSFDLKISDRIKQRSSHTE
jgi:hypothetical protein